MTQLTDSPPMTCEEAEAMLPLVADGVLSPDDDPSLFAHLASCATCQRSLLAYDLADLALGGHPAEPAQRTLRLRAPWLLAIAAALLASAGLTWWLQPGHEEPGSEPPMASGVEVLDILPPGPGSDQPRYRVRRGDQVFIVESIDGRMPSSAPDRDGNEGRSTLVPVNRH